MPTIGWVLLGLAAVAALANWWAVDTPVPTPVTPDGAGSPQLSQRVEYVAKPATMVLLIAVAVMLDPADGGSRAWFVLGLLLCLAGDVLLMLPSDRFLHGLAAFLAGHVAYIVGFWARGVQLWALLLGVLVVAVTVAVVARPIVEAVQRDEDPELVGPVLAYIGVISAMVVLAIGTTVAIAIMGGLLFYASDALLAWNRFVRPLPHGRLLVMITYHLAQAALVLSLAG